MQFNSTPIVTKTLTIFRAMWLQAVARFGLSLFIDQLTGNLERNTLLRATQLRQTIEKLGPAYVKVAQVRVMRLIVIHAGKTQDPPHNLWPQIVASSAFTYLNPSFRVFITEDLSPCLCRTRLSTVVQERCNQ